MSLDLPIFGIGASGWSDAPLRDLILGELAPHAAGDGGKVRVDRPPVMLKPQAGLFLTLVMHELTTSAANYGALSAPEGWVELFWGIARSNPPSLELDWHQSGGPEIEAPAKPGFGLELIECGIRFELQGEAKIGALDGGLDCEITIPAIPEYFSFGSATDTRKLQDAAS